MRLIIGDKNLGMLETIPEVFPDARYQRCTVHFYRNIFSVTPRKKMKAVALMLKAIHSQESKEAAREKAIQVAEKLKAMKLAKAAQKVEDGIEETLTYMDFPTQHWTRIRTNNTLSLIHIFQTHLIYVDYLCSFFSLRTPLVFALFFGLQVHYNPIFYICESIEQVIHCLYPQYKQLK